MSTSTDSPSGSSTCPVLVGPENYQIWRIRIEAKLQMEKVYGLIDGTYPKPTSGGIKSTVTRNTQEGTETSPESVSLITSTTSPDEKDLREWNIANAKARGIIVNYVSDEIAIEVHSLDSKDAQVIFAHIVEKFETTNAGSTAFGAFLDLIELKWDGSSDFASHTGKFLGLTAKLAALKYPITELFKVYLFLRSLPNTPTWQVFTTAYINSSSGKQDDLKVTDVISRAASQVSNNNSLANSSQQSQQAYLASTGNGKKCLYHKSGGHSTDDCWIAKKLLADAAEKEGIGGKDEKKRSTRFRSRKKKENAKVAEATDTGDGGGGSDSDEYAHRVYLPAESKKRIEAYVVVHSPEIARKQIFFDSAASSNMTPNARWILPETVKPLDKPVAVHLGDDSVVEGIARGTMRVRTKRKSQAYADILDVLLVPKLASTLISVPALAKHGYELVFNAEGASAYLKGKHQKQPTFSGRLTDGMYRLNGFVDENNFSAAFVAHTTGPKMGGTIDIRILHRRLGHASESRLRKMVKEGQLAGITSIEGKLGICEACARGKMKKLPFRNPSRRETTAPFELVHTDVGGPITPQTPSGYRYWIVFVDDYTRYPWVLFMRKKEEAPSIIKTFYNDVMAYFKSRIAKFRFGEDFFNTLRSDGGGEYVGEAVERFLTSNGIFHERSAPYTPEQNGLAERMNQSLRNCAAAMLVDSGLPKTYWSEAMSTAAHIISRTPASGIGGEIPFERMFNRKVDISLFRPFGCTGYALIPKQFRDGKFGDNARKCILLGYESGQRAYRLLDTVTRKVISSRHVAFDEDAPNNAKLSGDTSGDWGELFWHQRSASNTPKIPSNTNHLNLPDDEDSLSDDLPEPVGALDNLPAPPAIVPQDDAHLPAPPPQLHAPLAPVLPAPIEPQQRRRRNAAPLPPPRVQPQRERKVPTDLYREALNKEGTRMQEKRERADEERQRRLAPEPVGAGAEGGVGPNDAGNNANQEPVVGAQEQAAAAAEDGKEDGNGHGIQLPRDPNTDLPLTIPEALARPHDGHHWMGARDSELQSLQENEVYTVVRIPAGVKPIASKPVMRVKLDANGDILTYKIRIVAKGFHQVKGRDYHDTFAPVANLESIRLILALAAQFNLELDQMDVKTAYLNGILDEDIYIMPPDGVPIEDGYCWKLKKSLYGLKQSGRTWNKTLDSSLLDMGFIRLDAETCLYLFKQDGDLCFVVVYVDDLLLAATSRRFMDSIKKKLGSRFKMKDLGPAKYILGMGIYRDRQKRTISISQRRYIDSVLERTGMSNCKPASTPIPTSNKATIHDPNDDTIIHSLVIDGRTVTFKSVIGSLMYAMLATRPDLAFAVGLLGRYAAAPKQVHWTLAKRCLRYLQATKDIRLVYDGSLGSRNMTFIGYVDAAWSDDVDTSKSTGGYVFVSNGAAVGWSSKRQSMVALSSTEAEYISMCSAGQHLAWLRTFFEDINQPQEGPTTLFNDNQGAIALSKDPQYRARTKHIQRKYHFVRDDLVRKGTVKIEYLPTEEMIADIMTKPLPRETHWKFVEAMGLRMGSSGSVRNALASRQSVKAGTIRHGKVDIRRSRGINPADELEDPPSESAWKGWRYVAGALFGRKPWKENIPGESKWIRNVRGTATVVVVLVLAIYGAYKVILKPIAEKGMIPSHDFRAFVLPGNFKTSRKVVYNLIVAWDTQQDAPEALFDAVSVDATPTLERPTPAPCAKAHTDSLNSSLPSSYQALIFQCTQQEWKSYSLHRLVRDRSLRSPSLQLRVDFSGLRTGNRSLSEGVDFTDDSLQIWLGFTDDIADVTNATAPLPLFPGANLLTAFHYSIRQKLKPASLATAGFEMYSTFLTPSFVYTVPNPLITATTPNVSTLRIVPAFQPGELVIQQDFRNHSVLNGLSALGGLGTFLSTLFVIILGRGLMQTMRGRKPYSPFGLFHKTSREQGIIKEKCSTRYPKIAQEVDAFTAKASNLPGEQHHSERGVVAFLLDALIDLEGLGFEHGRPEGNHTVGTHTHGHGQGEDVEGKIEGSHTG